MARLILIDRQGKKLQLPAALDGNQKTIFSQHLENGQTIGQCSGHSICKGCILQVDDKDAGKFVEVIEHPHNLKSNERLACCTTFNPQHEDDEAEVVTPRNIYMG